MPTCPPRAAGGKAASGRKKGEARETHQPAAQDVEVVTGEDGAGIGREDPLVAGSQGRVLCGGECARVGGVLVRQAHRGAPTPSPNETQKTTAGGQQASEEAPGV